MNEYLLLFRGGNHDMEALAKNAPDQLQRWMQWMEGLAAMGKLGAAQPLTTSGKQITGNKKVVTDGPFMEGKEMVGGYLICKADTYEEAVELAKGCPILEFDDGIVEVRETQQLKK